MVLRAEVAHAGQAKEPEKRKLLPRDLVQLESGMTAPGISGALSVQGLHEGEEEAPELQEEGPRSQKGFHQRFVGDAASKDVCGEGRQREELASRRSDPAAVPVHFCTPRFEVCGPPHRFPFVRLEADAGVDRV